MLNISLPTEFEDFLSAYMDAMFWAESILDPYGEDQGSFQRNNYTPDDLDLQSYLEILRDCADFFLSYQSQFGERYTLAGHDFYLTRNGHGAGFWDGDWPASVATRLTNAAKAHGTQGLSLDGATVYTHG